MKFKHLLASLFYGGLLCLMILSCGKDDNKPTCHEFSSADSTCYCSQHEDDLQCNEAINTTFTLTLLTEEKPELTPHPSNGTIWCKGFVIGNFIYVIDRESDSPQAFWKYDLTKEEDWVAAADFPGDRYGLTGTANGKGYASSRSSNKFWEYDPGSNEWTSLEDLPFAANETHWVEYEGNFFVPDNDGIFEFNTTTKEWTKFSDQTSTGFGAVFLIDDDMYWYNINDDAMSHLNLTSKQYELVPVPENFNSSITFNSPFILGDIAYVVSNTTLWIFDNNSKAWIEKEDAITSGSAYADDVFVKDGTAYLIDNGSVKIFEPEVGG